MSEAAVGLELINELRILAERRHSDPGAVRDRATEVLAWTDPAPPPEARPVAEWVLALALHELGEAEAAVGHFRQGVELADERGDVATAALARASRAISLVSLGRSGEAEDEIAHADRIAPRQVQGQVDVLRALVEQRLGRFDDALALYETGLKRLDDDGDEHNRARALLNRGTLFAYQGSIDAALADYVEVERLARKLGLHMLVAMAAHNVGFAQGRRGAIAEALGAFDRAGAAYEELGGSRRHVPVLASDRCDVLLQVGLTGEALAAAEQAVGGLAAVDAAHGAEARVLLAQACLANGDLDRAIAEAEAAAAAFRAAARGPWAALAGYVAMQAVVRASEDDLAPPDPALLTRALDAAEELEREGWRTEALHVRTVVGRLALALDQPAVAARELARAAAARGQGPAGLRAQAWHATALVALAEGDRAGAQDALRSGLGVLDHYTARLGATELRIGAAAHGLDLARLGVRLALAEGDPWEVLEWAERWRAGALRLLPVRPPEDPVLAESLTELRSAESDLREATLAGSPPPDLAQRLSRIAALEQAVRDRHRRGTLGPAEPAAGHGDVDRDALASRLDGRTLIELVSVAGELHAVVVTGARARLLALGPVDQVDLALQRVLFVLRRLLDPRLSRSTTLDDLDAVARRLDDLVLAPLGLDGTAPGRGVVIVPTHPLHRVPWTALPSLAGRPVTVAPSTALWQRPNSQGGATGGAGRQVLLVAGPDLANATTEIDALAGRYAGARRMTGAGATVDAFVDAVAGADLVHVAAHGRFRGDSPLFSSFRLADGPLTIYDLEQRGVASGSTFVLAVCDAAASRTGPGDEVLGTATALLGLGAGAVVAPVLPVPDRSTTPFVLAIHAALDAGSSPGAALAGARGALVDRPPAERAVASAFVCIGAAGSS